MIRKWLKYIQDNPKGYWFKRKLFGWGWTPATWQGWVLTAGYVILVIAFALTIDERSPDKEVALMFVLPLIIVTAAFIAIAYKKGEPPKWQWGFPPDNNEEK